MNPKITFTKNPEVSSKATEAELILYDASMEAVHILNRTAYLIWELCDGMHSISDIERAMRERFSVDNEYDLLRDIDLAIHQLLSKGLLIEDLNKDVSNK
ncbi:MAG: PqqD family protein [Anaerolineales bacterium]|nr:PqqD family protein [Anaerolineales bacterium]